MGIANHVDGEDGHRAYAGGRVNQTFCGGPALGKQLGQSIYLEARRREAREDLTSEDALPIHTHAQQLLDIVR